MELDEHAPRERDETPPTGECAICSCDVWSREYVCDDCCNIVCPACDGRQIEFSQPGRYDKRDEISPCSVCDGDGFVTYALAKRLGYKVQR